MKLFILIFLFMVSAYSFGNQTSTEQNEEVTKIVKINQLLELFEVDEWIDYVKRVKNDELIPAYFSYSEPSTFERNILIKYDLTGYASGIIKQFNKHLTTNELRASIELFKRPFLIKTLKKLDNISFDYSQIVSESKGNSLSDSRSNLIRSIYNLTSMQVIVDYEFKKYQLLVTHITKTKEILKNDKKTVASKDKVIELDPKRFMGLVIISINNELSKYKDVELAEFIRILKKSKDGQKSIQVYRTFNYLYSQKFI
jgi:hypothetical protein